MWVEAGKLVSSYCSPPAEPIAAAAYPYILFCEGEGALSNRVKRRGEKETERKERMECDGKIRWPGGMGESNEHRHSEDATVLEEEERTKYVPGPRTASWCEVTAHHSAHSRALLFAPASVRVPGEDIREEGSRDYDIGGGHRFVFSGLGWEREGSRS